MGSKLPFDPLPNAAQLITWSLKDISAHREEAIIISCIIFLFPTVSHPGSLLSLRFIEISSLVRTSAYVLPLCLSISSHTTPMNDKWRLEVCRVPTECIMQRGSTKHMLHLLCHVKGRSALGGNRDHWEDFTGMLCLPRILNNILFRGHLAFWIPWWWNPESENLLPV